MFRTLDRNHQIDAPEKDWIQNTAAWHFLGYRLATLPREDVRPVSCIRNLNLVDPTATGGLLDSSFDQPLTRSADCTAAGNKLLLLFHFNPNPFSTATKVLGFNRNRQRAKPNVTEMRPHRQPGNSLNSCSVETPRLISSAETSKKPLRQCELISMPGHLPYPA